MPDVAETRLLNLENDQKNIREKLDGLATQLSDFIDAVRAGKREEHFSRKDVIQLIMGAVGLTTVLGAGANYVIDSRIAPVKSDQTSAAQQINARLDVFQDSIRSLREIAADQQKSIGNTNVELSKDRKTLDQLERLNLGALNARQDADINAASKRLDILEHRDEKAYDRTLDKADKAR